eukprot:NODE_385_length_8329_cov_0.434386.p2 type:complete len:403 gc:universal NODE_385_length_8329_cov_0.434386:5296-6504(+)
MTSNPFHSQDSHLIFTPPSQNTSIPDSVSNSQDQEDDFDMDQWLTSCSQLECCPLTCLQLCPQDFLSTFKSKYLPMNKQERDIFLKGVLTSCQHYSQNQSRRTFKYHIYPMGSMCRNALVHLLSISRQQLQNIANDLSHFKSRIHGNRGIKFQHALTAQQNACIKEFIFDFAENHGEPRPGRQYTYKHSRRTRDMTFIWLPSDFTISKLHDIYLNSEDAIQIKFETFRRLFHDCETIRIRSPRSDMCDTCITHDMKQTDSETVLMAVTRDFQEHLNQAKVARLDYTRCKHRTDVTCLSFDYSQNLVLPQFQDQPSELYFLSLLNIFLFGIHNETKKKQMNYIYREDQGKKGGDNVVSLLIDYIFLLPTEQRRHLILFADNCGTKQKQYHDEIISLVVFNRQV